MTEAYCRLVEQIKSLEESANILKEKILAEFSPEPGEHCINADGATITVKIGRRLEWDQGILHAAWEDIQNQRGVSREDTIKIDAKHYDNWDAEAKGLVRPALTVRPHGSKISIHGSE